MQSKSGRIEYSKNLTMEVVMGVVGRDCAKDSAQQRCLHGVEVEGRGSSRLGLSDCREVHTWTVDSVTVGNVNERWPAKNINQRAVLNNYIPLS